VNGRVILIFGLLLAALLSQGGGVSPLVPSGPRTIAIVYESGKSTPELAAVATLLRNGEAAEKIKQSGSDVFVIDKELQNEKGELVPILKLAGQVDVPEVIVADKPVTRILSRKPCKYTVEQVLGELP
jgi:hypothetical protein